MMEKLLPLLPGAFLVAALILAPAALLAVTVRLGLRRPPRGSIERRFYQGTALATGLAIMLSGCGLYRLSARQVPAESPTVSPRPLAEASERAVASTDETNVFELWQRSDELSGRLERADWEVSARARDLGPGIEPAFGFLRDHIGYEPYAGILRGAAGTYATRAGNASDRALLLAELLQAKGVRTRFAVGALDNHHSAQLYQQAFARQAPAAGETRRLDQGDRFHQRLFRRAKADYEAVRAVLGNELQPVTAPPRDTILADMNPHVWLHAEHDGRWVDLDPSLPASTPGQTIAALDRTFDELPEDLFQRVTIRVVAEHAAGGALRSSTRLEVMRRAVDLVDTQVFLIHSQPMAATGLGAAIARGLGRGAGDVWTPGLWIAGETTSGQPVDLAAADFVAEWLEFELMWPGGRREVTRRALIDRGGSAWRTAGPLEASLLAPLARNERGALAPQAIHNIWFSAGRHRLTDFAEATRLLLLDEAAAALAEADRQAGSAPAGDSLASAPKRADEFARQVWPFLLQNFASVVFTDHVVLPLLNSTPGVRLYAEAPRITLFTMAPTVDVGVTMQMDLRRDDLRGLAADPSKALLAADMKLRFGALQGALEHELLAEVTLAGGGSADGVRSTSGLLAGKRLGVATPGAAASGTNAAAVAELRAALAGGRTVVAAAGRPADTHAWWEVLPSTGDVRAVADWGLHGSGTPNLRGKALQQNSFGEQKIYDLRSQGEIRKRQYDIRRAEAQAKADAEAAQYRNRLTQPQQAEPRGGGSEYAVLIVVGAVGKIALAVASYLLLLKLFEEIELFASWIADGGFNASWP